MRAGQQLEPGHGPQGRLGDASRARQERPAASQRPLTRQAEENCCCVLFFGFPTPPHHAPHPPTHTSTHSPFLSCFASPCSAGADPAGRQCGHEPDYVCHRSRHNPSFHGKKGGAPARRVAPQRTCRPLQTACFGVHLLALPCNPPGCSYRPLHPLPCLAGPAALPAPCTPAGPAVCAGCRGATGGADALQRARVAARAVAELEAVGGQRRRWQGGPSAAAQAVVGGGRACFPAV